MDSADPAGRRLLFLVDDYADSAKSLSMLLRLNGYDVESFGSGKDVLQALETTRPHAILLDISMPGMTGYDVADWIRGQSHLAGVPIIGVTGHGTDADRKRASVAGFTFHVLKPVNLDALLDLLRSV